jgi:hypothetical protein
LDLNGAAVPLQDGFDSWNASAADALAIWNQYLDTIEVVPGAAVPAYGRDKKNSAVFSKTIYGEGFPPGVLAVTLHFSSDAGGTIETDVIFNSNRSWNSYRGPEQPVFDFHRVALHEFGHVLGLSHPDENGQGVTAIMNSTISDLDHVADDDIAGARTLYGIIVTSSLTPPSVYSGANFSYQITANNQPSGFSATGLPPGLQLNASTGWITGKCATSGTFSVNVTAQGASSTASGTVRIVILPLPISSDLSRQIQIGESFSYQIAAANNPTSYQASSLPAGLQFNASTGALSGIPKAPGTFQIQLVARSATSEAKGVLTLVVMPPRITSVSDLPFFELGDPFSYTITATNSPTSFGATNLPPWLHLNPSTGVISGSAGAPGTFDITVTAQTAHGVASATLSINVLPARITSPLYTNSVEIGSSFTYEISASNRPTSFSANGLPAGLQIDPATGKITGVVEISGEYHVQVFAYGAGGVASDTITITVAALEVADVPFKKFEWYLGGTIIADPVRPRLYVPMDGGIAVIDTDTLNVIQTVPIFLQQVDMSLSVDGNKLWITGYYDFQFRYLDLNTLTISDAITTTVHPKLMREGADGRLYVTDYIEPDVFQLDPNTGAILSRVNPGTSGSELCEIETSPDKTTLYVLSWGASSPLAKYSLSPGNPPALMQRVESNNPLDYGWKMAVSPDGGSVAVVSRDYALHELASTVFRSAIDLNVVQGNPEASGLTSQVAYSADGLLWFQGNQDRSRIDVFQTSSAQRVRTFTLPDRTIPSDGYSTAKALAVDRTNSYLFVASTSSPGWGLYVYSLASTQPPPAPPNTLLNVATRLRTQGGENVLIGGFIIKGTQPKQIALRAMGPSLPVPGKLADPVLELFDSLGVLVARNDNWNAHRVDVVATGLAPSQEHEAVITASLPPGAYTAVVRGFNNSNGVALVEAYDLTSNSNSKLANISTRGKVEAGDNVMIGGFILGGDQLTTVVVRAIGPSLANLGVGGVLSDPMLEARDGNGALIAEDDDWRTYQQALLIQTGLAPTDERESALFLELPPGAYTAIVRGKNNTTGVGLVEVYNLDAN